MQVRGYTIFPFIFLSNSTYKEDQVLINHERIHIRQQMELLLIPFVFWYFMAYFRRGYRLISFEQEAYENEQNLDYLKRRKPFAFWKYVK
ncbi:MAG: hypothetical protein EP338_00375 [Bacteroidetes bacterium]|nr:MAG: hypothetical protein EP338_00375 [Bacteroidota bacterium]